jgi:tetratricopeptide (TPR) repeat protein
MASVEPSNNNFMTLHTILNLWDRPGFDRASLQERCKKLADRGVAPAHNYCDGISPGAAMVRGSGARNWKKLSDDLEDTGGIINASTLQSHKLVGRAHYLWGQHLEKEGGAFLPSYRKAFTRGYLDAIKKIQKRPRDIKKESVAERIALDFLFIHPDVSLDVLSLIISTHFKEEGKEALAERWALFARMYGYDAEDAELEILLTFGIREVFPTDIDRKIHFQLNISKAATLIKEKKYREAKEKALAASHTGYGAAFDILGTAYREGGSPIQALRCFKAALEKEEYTHTVKRSDIDEESLLEIKQNMALCYDALDREDEALPLYLATADLHKRNTGFCPTQSIFRCYKAIGKVNPGYKYLQDHIEETSPEDFQGIGLSFLHLESGSADMLSKKRSHSGKTFNKSSKRRPQRCHHTSRGPLHQHRQSS